MAAALGGIVLLAACEGSNLFSPDQTGTNTGTNTGGGTPPPGGGTTGPVDGIRPAVTILDPARDSLAKPVGDSLFVRVRVTDNVGVRQVRLFGTSERGDPDLGTDTTVLRFNGKLVQFNRNVVDTTLTRYLIPTADATREAVDIIVEATDSTGNLTADTVVLIVGGPDVQFPDLVDGQTVRAGTTLGVRVFARDPLGIVAIGLQASGVATLDTALALASVEDTIVSFDIAVPATAGNLLLTATARNDLGVESAVGPVTLTVVTGGPGDIQRPSVRHDAVIPTRMELQETIDVDVFARDDTQGDGIVAIGVTVVATSPDSTTIRTDSIVYTTARTGLVTTSFSFPAFNVDTLNLPVDMIYEITSWAFDGAGNCGAARGADTLSAEVCAPYGRVLGTGEILDTQDTIQVQGLAGERFTARMVNGRTITLPAGGLIMDAAVDTFRQNLYLSNLGRNRIEVFELDTEIFAPPIPVGSEPWGLTMNYCFAGGLSANCGDTLIVANSGGTNISMVDLDALAEDANRRLLTPDVLLFEVSQAIDGSGLVRYGINFIPGGASQAFAWSDRPQYIARDSSGQLLYSTKTVLLEPVEIGTVRKAFVPPGLTRTEVVLFTQHTALIANPDFFAIANVDYVELYTGTGALLDDQAQVFDHVTGTTTPIVSTIDYIEDALTDIRAKGSDVVYGNGRWNLEDIGFQDTTYVSASGDGGWVAIGEGDTEAENEVARILVYDVANDSVTVVEQVTDRMTNDAEIVRGIGLNQDGTFGVARGRDAYFWTTDLRLQGVADVEVPGGAGAALHPLHADAQHLSPTGATVGGYHPDTHLAFIPTGENTIDIYDTFHFFRLGRLFIRDVVVGPLRAALPFPADNAGLTCPLTTVLDRTGAPVGQAVDIYAGDGESAFGSPYDATGNGGVGAEDRCIVLKLYGPTSSGGVVVVNVRKSDILRNHPQR